LLLFASLVGDGLPTGSGETRIVCTLGVSRRFRGLSII
jgi:hypothetical protein